jgi:hypothetical protein
MDQFTDRRGSISVYDTYSLPTSKADMRRFSSYEQLAPFFQQILSQESASAGRVPAAPAPAPTSPSAASNSSTSPTVPSPLVRSRRGSIGSRFASALTGSFRRQKSASARQVVSESESEASCDDLDAKLAEIKGKLAQFKSEDIAISQRVEDLSSSVEDLYASTPECSSPLSHQDHLYSQLREEKMRRSNSFQSYRPSVSTSGLQSISENDSELDDREKEERDSALHRAAGQVTLRRSPPLQRSRPSSYASISEEPESSDDTNTKSYCLLNNTLRLQTKDRAKSLTQIPHVIRNDLSRPADSADASQKRNSVISIMSDSVLITHRHLPAMRSLLKEQEL